MFRRHSERNGVERRICFFAFGCHSERLKGAKNLGMKTEILRFAQDDTLAEPVLSNAKGSE